MRHSFSHLSIAAMLACFATLGCSEDSAVPDTPGGEAGGGTGGSGGTASGGSGGGGGGGGQAGSGSALEGYPRLAMHIFGSASPSWYAEFDWVMLPGKGDLLAAKALNPDLLVSTSKDHNNCESFFGDTCPEAWRIKDPDGNWVHAYGSSHLGNTTDHCGLHEGKTYRQYIVDYHAGEDWDVLDGTFSQGLWQNVSWLDLDIDGDGDSDGEDDDLWKTGRLKLLAELRAALGPDKLIVINGGGMRDFWGKGHETLNGVMAEKMFRYSGWEAFKSTTYPYYAEQGVTPHAMYIDGNYEVDPDEGGHSKNNFRYMRFGLAVTLMYDGYYSYTDGEEGAANEHWWVRYYDEYDVPLGQPLGPVYEIRHDLMCRFFEGGAMILNAGEQDDTVTEADLMAAADAQGLDWATIAGIDGHYYRFSGQQNPDVNDGSLLDTILLPSKAYGNDRRKGDGILLVRAPDQVVAAAVIVDTESFVTSPGATNATLSGFARSCDYDDGFRTGRNHCHPQANPFYGHTRAATGSGATASFEVMLVHDGNYRVLEYHPDVDGYDVPYTVHSADGSQTFHVDQRTNTEQWNELGVFHFAAGSVARVEVTADASGSEVAADAIRFEWVGPSN